MATTQDKFAEFVLAWSKVMVMCWSDDQFRAELFKADAAMTRKLFRDQGYELPSHLEVTVRTSVPEEIFRDPEKQPRATDNWKLASSRLELMVPPPPPSGMRALAVLDFLKAEQELFCFCC
ncbi:hypothetical protein F0U61_27135 [Archangium violaceum]|uniref:hypothetical protein n=1 Tax=Archangium violaceum TaxID=83451 RepID=UPI002B2D297F|nr:hypothetical protein F0U61_27135 [Archangium violaceum]